MNTIDPTSHHDHSDDRDDLPVPPAVSGEAFMRSMDHLVRPVNGNYDGASFYELLHQITDGIATLTDEDEVVMGIHPRSECLGCWIHQPSAHGLAYSPVVYRDGRFMRVCEHAEKHFDVDENAFYAKVFPDFDLDTDCPCWCDCCERDLEPLSDGLHYELPLDARGMWQVTTHGSTHIFDFEANTWARYSQRSWYRSEQDGIEQRIVKFGTRPLLSRRTLIWYESDTHEGWRLSSGVLRIKQIEWPDEP